MNILVLEDNIERIKKFREKFAINGVKSAYTDSVEDCIYLLKNQKWDILFLEHDLGGHVYVESDGEELTGWHVAKWLSENSEKMPNEIIIHSLNESGRKNMLSLLPMAQEVPFAWNLIKIT